jgi:hypothetical protein
MHWALVLVLAMITGGVFGFIWFCIQAGYAKRIHPASKARLLIVLSILLIAGMFVLSIGAAVAGAAMQSEAVLAAIGLLALGISFAAAACSIAAVFSIRKAMQTYFNTAEPIGLRMSGVMTFFFGILYLQYHMTRIADWKRTGALR